MIEDFKNFIITNSQKLLSGCGFQKDSLKIDKEKSNELILRHFKTNISKTELQKSFNRNKKANKDKKKINLTFKLIFFLSL